MAELNRDIDTEFEISVETDAAQSTDYVQLASLDIGSECTVVTEPKEDDRRQVIAIPEEGEHEREENVYIEGQADNDIEAGVKSLNLDKGFHPPGDQDADETESREGIDDIGMLSQQDRDGDTQLHLAIIMLSHAITHYLIYMYACIPDMIDIQNNIGQTPLHLAVLTRQNNVAQQLLMAGAARSYRDQFLRTPMDIACQQNDLYMLETLCFDDNWCVGAIEAASGLLDPATHPLNLPNADGERCIHLAVRQNNIEIARLLIANGADVNLPERRSGRTPLHMAADLGHVDMARFLTSVDNIDINQKTYSEETALEIAHMRGRENVVALLKPLCFPMMKRKSKSDQSA